MHILCDTCCILMLIRIAPEMFRDERFGCVTIQEVRGEIFRTQKFKTKYPWRNEYKDKILAVPNSKQTEESYTDLLNAIRTLIDNGTTNEKKKRLFDLSWVDQKVMAFAIANGCKINSEDVNLIEFAVQEFGELFSGHVSSLGLINEWLEAGLIEWSETRQAYIEEWYYTKEPNQSSKEIKKFKRLTGYNYVRS